MDTLLDFMKRIPAVHPEIASGSEGDGTWWIKFSLDVRHDLAWNVVQELGHVCNWLSLDERLPTRFFPVSAPPYLNGGPDDFLYWIIASTDIAFSPAHALEWLEGRLPNPVDDLESWKVD